MDGHNAARRLGTFASSHGGSGTQCQRLRQTLNGIEMRQGHGKQHVWHFPFTQTGCEHGQRPVRRLIRNLFQQGELRIQRRQHIAPSCSGSGWQFQIFDFTQIFDPLLNICGFAKRYAAGCWWRTAFPFHLFEIIASPLRSAVPLFMLIDGGDPPQRLDGEQVLRIGRRHGQQFAEVEGFAITFDHGLCRGPAAFAAPVRPDIQQDDKCGERDEPPQ